MTVAELERAIQAEERLSSELGQYAGEWVAVSSHQVVAHAPTLRELRGQIEEKKTAVERIFRVPEGEGTACFY